jgi:hypothetical protein
MCRNATTSRRGSWRIRRRRSPRRLRMAHFKAGTMTSNRIACSTLHRGQDGAFGRAVRALYEDSSGNLWVGAEPEGAQQRSRDLVSSARQMQRLAACFPTDRNRGLPLSAPRRVRFVRAARGQSWQTGTTVRHSRPGLDGGTALLRHGLLAEGGPSYSGWVLATSWSCSRIHCPHPPAPSQDQAWPARR